MTVAHDLVHAPAATKIVSVASATATRKVAAGGSGALPHVILGPESWDQRVGAGESRAGRAGTRELGPGVAWNQRGGTNSWDQRVGTGELRPESWDQRGGTREVELGPEGLMGVRRRWDGNPLEMGQDS